jgi:hypothetical protein
MRNEIAEQIAIIYKTTLKPEIISDCDGCKVNDGRLFAGCSECEMRKCVIQFGLENCAYCHDYACEKLKRH